MTNEEIISVVQAHSEGKVIELKIKRTGDKWEITEAPVWNFDDFDYRVKPESKVRPYTFDEVCEAIKKHGLCVKPKASNTNGIATITTVNDGFVYLKGTFYVFQDFARDFVWFDDNSPCGIVEE